ncbi:MAG TPA: response regulator transcription factor [Ktedonobacterales bacterium]|jgi:DNA-binding response OmpR family regulator|nr:response regulator transcription factor [Ktedonobacterales bacterium]
MGVILVVEDEADLCNVIRAHLEAEGHTLCQAFDGPSALAVVEEHAPELVVLDRMLPGLGGLSVCRRIRETHRMPILMLTARAEEADRVLGLEVGADDYVVKPFSMRELMARVRALLRRIALDSQVFGADEPESLPPAPVPIVCGPRRVDPAARIVAMYGEPMDLTPKEVDVLLLFVTYPGRACSQRFLRRHLWSDEYEGLYRTVDTHVTRLRKKLGPSGDHIVCGVERWLSVRAMSGHYCGSRELRLCPM